MPGVRKLTPTSYAILGLLGLRSWSAYELTKQGRRSLHFCWPRAETRIYQEPKNLLEHGLVKATSTAQGRRARTEYAITAKGRKALRAWMGEPSAPPRLESEALLRVFFAEHGTKEGLLATLAELEGQALAMRRQAVEQGAEYLAGTARRFPERIHILGLVGRFTLDHTALVAGVGPVGPGRDRALARRRLRGGQPRGGAGLRGGAGRAGRRPSSTGDARPIRRAWSTRALSICPGTKRAPRASTSSRRSSGPSTSCGTAGTLGASRPDAWQDSAGR